MHYRSGLVIDIGGRLRRDDIGWRRRISVIGIVIRRCFGIRLLAGFVGNSARQKTDACSDGGAFAGKPVMAAGAREAADQTAPKGPADRVRVE
jgi:hypothetical protein